MVKPIINAYPGIKSSFLPDLYRYFPRDYRVYLEPFVGSYVVVLNLPPLDMFSRGLIPRAKLPVIMVNDIDSGIIDLGRAFLEKPIELYESTRNMIQVEGLRNELKAYKPNGYFENAVRKLYMLYSSFGRVSKETSGFAYRLTNNRQDYPDLVFQDVHEINKRLREMKIFNSGYEVFLERFVHKEKDIFIYLDPPYEGSDPYEEKFNHRIFAMYLKTISVLSDVKWLLSYNDSPTIRDYYEEFHIFEKDKTYYLKNGSSRKTNELLIANYLPANVGKKSSLSEFF